MFALGVGISITGFADISRKAIGWNGKRLQSLASYAKPALGIVLLLVGTMVLTSVDKQIETWMVEALPGWLIRFTTRF